MVRRGKRPRRHNPRNKRPQHKPRRRKYSLFERMACFSRKHPIAVGVILLFASLILFRLSFTPRFSSSPEAAIWAWIVSAILFIASLLVLKGYWKRNVPDIHAKGNVIWQNR